LTKINYRPEIDGLRAIAVFAVIVYHAKIFLFGHQLFQGGFIGVDIFFVISGYLITTLILKELNETNSFSFKNFYERRARRILPALLFMMGISSVVGYYLLLPVAFIDFAKSNITAIFSVSNFYFYLEDIKYAATSELVKPLLHTWSLSVEEQFYFIFPVLLIILIKFFKKLLIKILIFIFIISLCFAEYYSRIDTYFNFYLLLSRGFELIIGSLLSYLELNKIGKSKYNPILNQIYPGIGIILIFCSFFFFNIDKIFHPGITTLMPVIGASLIIWFSKKEGLIVKILSNKILVFFGLISYSLYLWHYSVFAFYRNSPFVEINQYNRYILIIIILLISIFSYYFIEKPFRNKKIVSTKKLIISVLSSIITLLVFNLYILRTEGIKKTRLPNILNENLKFNGEIQRNNKGSEIEVILIGDSHAGALEYYLNEKLKEKKSSLLSFITHDFYLYVQGFNKVNRKTKIISQDDLNNNKKINVFLYQHKDSIIIFHQKWSRILTEKDDQDYETCCYFEPLGVFTSSLDERQKYLSAALRLSINNIIQQGHPLIIIYPVPEMGFNVPLIMQKKLFYFVKDKKVPILAINYEKYKKRNELIFQILDGIQGPNIYRVYPDKFFCNTIIAHKCVANNKDHLFYFDSNHLSVEGSKYVVNDIMKVIQQIEVNKKVKSSKNSISQN
jgi:peptidoglycan/LPS O-acetylase OafA/YrhL